MQNHKTYTHFQLFPFLIPPYLSSYFQKCCYWLGYGHQKSNFTFLTAFFAPLCGQKIRRTTNKYGKLSCPAWPDHLSKLTVSRSLILLFHWPDKATHWSVVTPHTYTHTHTVSKSVRECPKNPSLFLVGYFLVNGFFYIYLIFSLFLLLLRGGY